MALVAALAGTLVMAPPAMAAAPTVVSLAFNDGFASQYRYAAPLLEQHGMDGTFYVASNIVRTNDANYMRLHQLDELYRQGNEIGGMGKDHVDLTSTTTDLAYKRDQVCGDFQALTDWGYHPASFTYPGGATNAEAQQLVRDCGFLTGRLPGGLSPTGPTYAEPVPPVNALALRSATTPAGPLTLATLQNAVTAAGDNTGGWVPIAFNRVCDSADANYTTCMGTPKPVDSQVLDDFLTWLEAQEAEGITVDTVGGVMGAPHPDLPQRPFVVTLTFDDGLRSQYPLREIFAKHDEHGTFYINSGPVDAGEAGTMTWAQIRELQAAGHDVGGHTQDHVNLLATDTSFDYKWHQVCDDRARLVEEGINAASFAFPFGAMDAGASALVRGCGYQSARKAGTVTSDGPIFSETIPVTENPWAIRILGTNYNGPVTLDALQYAVSQARSHGGSWLPTLYHQICYAGTPSFDSCMAGYRPVSDTTIDDFLGWLDGMADQNVEVKTIAEVMGGGTPAPQVAVTAPADGTTVAETQPQLTGTANGSSTVSVRLYDGRYSMGTPLATLSATVSNGTWSVQPGAALPDGTYTVQAAQTTGASTGTSVPVTFTVDASSVPVDTTAPAPTVTSPVAGSTVDTITPTIQGTGGTAVGDDGQVSVRVYAGSAATGTAVQTIPATVGATGSWSVNASALANGTYTVTATQGDVAGNLGTSTPVTFTVNTTPADTTAPAVAVTAPAQGATVDDATPTIAGTGGTAAGDDDQVSVAFYPSSEVQGDAVQTIQATVGSNGSWSATPTTLADGTWTVQATQTDTAGNVGTSTPVTFTVDTTPVDTTAPTVTITTPASGATVAATSLTAGGAAGTQPGDEGSVTVRLYTGTAATGTPAQTATPAAASGSWSTTFTGVAAGTYTVVASQRDAAGNTGTSNPVTVTMTAPPSGGGGGGGGTPPPADTTAPVVTISSPATGATLTASELTAEGTAGTQAGDKDSVDLDLYAGTTATGTPVKTATADVVSGAWSTKLSGLTPGTYTLVARQSDDAGNTGNSGAVTVTMKAPEPTPDTVTVTKLSRDKLGQGAKSVRVRVTGDGFAQGAAVAFSPAGVSARVVEWTATTLTLRVSVKAGTPVGMRDVTVTNADGTTGTCLDCLKVVAGPKITDVSPGKVTAERRWQKVTIWGSRLTSNTAVMVSGKGIRVGTTKRLSSTKMTVMIKVSRSAPETARSLTVLNRDTKGRATMLRALRVF